MRIQIPGIIPAALIIAAVAFVAVNWPGEPLAYMAVPADLAAALDDAIVLLNPGLFGMDETADAKKNARISAG